MQIKRANQANLVPKSASYVITRLFLVILQWCIMLLLWWIFTNNKLTALSKYGAGDAIYSSKFEKNIAINKRDNTVIYIYYQKK